MIGPGTSIVHEVARPGSGSAQHRLRRGAAFALLAVAALELHQAVDATAPVTGWALLSGGIGFGMGLWAAPQPGQACAGRAWLICVLATGLGLAVDAWRVPSALWLSVCAGAASAIGPEAWLRHVQLMPATAVATVAAVLAVRCGGGSAPGWRGSGLALGAALLEFALMSLLMLAAIGGVEGAADRFGLPWTADAMGTAMILGMSATTLLAVACRRLAGPVLRPLRPCPAASPGRPCGPPPPAGHAAARRSTWHRASSPHRRPAAGLHRR